MSRPLTREEELERTRGEGTFSPVFGTIGADEPGFKPAPARALPDEMEEFRKKIDEAFEDASSSDDELKSPEDLQEDVAAKRRVGGRTRFISSPSPTEMEAAVKSIQIDLAEKEAQMDKLIEKATAQEAEMSELAAMMRKMGIKPIGKK